MKLLVIVLCLLIERYWMPLGSSQRFYWFSFYGSVMEKQLAKLSFIGAPWVKLMLFLLPFLGTMFFILHQTSHELFGLVGLFFNVLILFGCIGPGNPFYPAEDLTGEVHRQGDVEAYLVKANEQLFAVLFWYFMLGPLAVLGYRLISESRRLVCLNPLASRLTNFIDWLPVRMTVLLYLLVGNFQAGLRNFSQFLIKSPGNNQHMLSVCGLDALGSGSESIQMVHAKNLVDHSVIVLLVFLALFTMVA